MRKTCTNQEPRWPSGRKKTSPSQDDEYAELTPDTEPWEWYESYARFREVLLCHLAGAVDAGRGQEPQVSLDDATMAQIRRLRVLIIGCGNSRLGEDMVEMDGFESVTCLDFSANVIRYMQARYAAKPQLNTSWAMPPTCELSFQGTFDALLCHPEVVRVVEALLGEIERVTRRGGLYLCVSQSDKRAFYFEDHFGARAQLRREAWAKAEESPMGHLNPVPFFHLYALSLPPHQEEVESRGGATDLGVGEALGVEGGRGGARGSGARALGLLEHPGKLDVGDCGRRRRAAGAAARLGALPGVLPILLGLQPLGQLRVIVTRAWPMAMGRSASSVPPLGSISRGSPPSVPCGCWCCGRGRAEDAPWAGRGAGALATGVGCGVEMPNDEPSCAASCFTLERWPGAAPVEVAGPRAAGGGENGSDDDGAVEAERRVVDDDDEETEREVDQDERETDDAEEPPLARRVCCSWLWSEAEGCLLLVADGPERGMAAGGAGGGGGGATSGADEDGDARGCQKAAAVGADGAAEAVICCCSSGATDCAPIDDDGDDNDEAAPPGTGAESAAVATAGSTSAAARRPA
ncbi:methyltransferase [Acanthamoeba castellanii str. Neff]|uniref:Methyltransferase n=1 Tax=Acanthamoeba castellanii (strain ATCC 30010 / Neff) TaxID=1257118 RepID=L8HIK6_ACACF|nr:methyltransferase [Acanthamoeba castellanii str. Neff]ELR25035.1 methyltransferase [Acanthamoeba castellanii str. Neff]